MSREYNEFCCWTIEKFSFFHNYFAIIDTADYLADQLFIKHQVRVGFGPEFVCPDAPYRVIMCKCRKRDVDAFLAAIRELPNKMLPCSHPGELALRIEEKCASARMTRSCALSREGMCLMPAISITALMVTRCSIRESTSSIPRTVIASGG